MEHFSKYFNLLLRMKWRGRREDGRDEAAALKNEVNRRNQINTMIIGISVRFLSNSRLNRKVSWLPPTLQGKLRVPSIQGVRVLSLILSEPHAVLVTSHLDIIIINLLPDYGSLVHGWNHIQNPTIEKSYKVISDHKVSNVCKECIFYTKDCNTDRCLSVCACEAASMSNCLRPHELYSPWNSPGQNTEVGSLSLLQGIFPTQGSNPGLPHCRQSLSQLSHKGSPFLHW